MSLARSIFRLIRDTMYAFFDDRLPTEAAAVAYFAIFSVAPLLVVVIEVVALILGQRGSEDLLRDDVLRPVRAAVGDQATNYLSGLISATIQKASSEGLIAGIIAWVVATFAATGFLGAIQQTLDTIWGVAKVKRPWYVFFHDRFIASVLIATASLLIVVSVTLNTIFSAYSSVIAGKIPIIVPATKMGEHFLTFVLLTLLFTAIFKLLPHTRVEWSDALPGAAVAGLLFLLGQVVMGWYLGRFGASSAFGAAASLIVLLLWTYYSIQMFLFGAEFSKTYAHLRAVATAPQTSSST